jgi:hypothetical protein
MPDESKYEYKFTCKHDEAWAWHVGINFCISPKDNFGKREIYLFICLGKHDFAIGMLHVYKEEE